MWPNSVVGAKRREQLVVTAEMLEASHRKCAISGLREDLVAPRIKLPLSEFLDIKNRAYQLIHIADRIFNVLDVVIPQSEKVFSLTDSCGSIIDIYGNQRMLESSYRLGIRPGVSFSDESVGTTAVSIALEYCMPVYLAGNDHYCRVFHNWECLGVPIVDAYGSILGCIGAGSYLGSSLASESILNVVSNLISRVNVWSSGGKEGIRDPQIDAYRERGIALSKRQLEILRFRANGYLNKQIAEKLNIQIDTVKEHISVALKRLGVKSVEEAVMVLATSWLIF